MPARALIDAKSSLGGLLLLFGVIKIYITIVLMTVWWIWFGSYASILSKSPWKENKHKAVYYPIFIYSSICFIWYICLLVPIDSLKHGRSRSFIMLHALSIILWIAAWIPFLAVEHQRLLSIPGEIYPAPKTLRIALAFALVLVILDIFALVIAVPYKDYPPFSRPEWLKIKWPQFSKRAPPKEAPRPPSPQPVMNAFTANTITFEV